MNSSQPNIVLIHADQHRADCLGAAGHSLLQTPNLDRLARQGTRFTHAFTPAPLCVPARNSNLYGCWPTRHQVIANPDTEAPRPARAGLTSWSEVLRRDAGYRMAYVGKWGIGSGPPTAFGFNEYVPESDYGRWRAEQGLPPAPHDGWFGAADAHITPEQSRLAWGADTAIRMISESARGEGPFLVRWDPSEPHPPCVLPEPYASMYSPKDIAPWLSFPDSLAGKPYMQSQMRHTWGIDGWTWEDWQPVVARYLGQISLLDAQVGRVLDTLDRLGLTGSTLVVYTCDHGDLCGGHGMFDKHYVMYDDVTRVPLIVRWPDRMVNCGNVHDGFVCQELDLAATLCDAAGVAIPETFQGQSLLPVLDDDAAGQDMAFSQYMGNQFGLYSQRMARDRRWKYVFNAVAEDELYDLETDPGELVNRAADPDCAVELQHLRRRLAVWMETIGDPLLNHWTRSILIEGRRASAHL